MKSLLIVVFTCILSTASFAAESVQKNCGCKECKCSQEAHCGCFSKDGCHCGHDGVCVIKDIGEV